MTPRRRDRFFQSLRQLEQRLASESSYTKKTRLARDDGFADAENANTVSEYGSHTTSHAGADVFKDGLADADAMCLTDRADITNTRVHSKDDFSVNRFDMLVNTHKIAVVRSIENRRATAFCENEAAGFRGIKDMICGTQCMSGPLPSIIEGNVVHHTANCFTRHVIGDTLHENRGKNGGTEYDIVNGVDAVNSSRDGIHYVNIDDFVHNRELVESVTMCEDEEQMYDATFSSEGEDSGSLLVLSARWNPWETCRHTSGSDSNPPAEFLSTPMINNTLDTIGRNTSESPSKCVSEDLQEQEGNGSQDLTRLCVLLGLDEHGLDMEPSPALRVNKFLSSDHSSPSFGALNHELSGSTFYSNDAKVGEKRFQYAEGLDFWLQRLSQDRTEPYCRALLLIAKASLQEDKGLSMYSSCKFPSIVQEWLAVQHAAES